MKIVLPRALLLIALGVNPADCFTVVKTSSSALAPRVTNFQRTLLHTSPTSSIASSSTALHAKKKKGNSAKDAALAALEAIEAQENSAASSGGTKTATALLFDDDEPLSKKEQMALEKKNKKSNNNVGAAPAANGAAAANLDLLLDSLDEPLTKKEQMALEKQREKEAKKAQKEQERLAAAEKDEIEKNKRKKALKALAEMEAAEKGAGMVNNDSVNGSSGGDNSDGGSAGPPMSKKEMKLAAQKAEKEAEKHAKKEMKKKAKKLGITVEELEQMEEGGGGNDDDDEFAIPANTINGDVNGDAAAVPGEEAKKDRLTAEERIRKERPPPRIRVMESSQPDYTAMRLENIAITFRDQPVLKSATWGVQTGDRIGLVGANGAGKTTQLRILAGELEPTAGDVVKSHKDLRVAMLRQEFIDEIDLTRTLREEFMSVFTEEAEIMNSLRAAEEELAQMSGSADDADMMQEVLDRMSKLQNKADSKNVNALDSRVSKIMDLMGFDPEEGDYEVSAFSGGWKMRIGLGKVLLQDPNILLLDEPTNHLVRFFLYFCSFFQSVHSFQPFSHNIIHNNDRIWRVSSGWRHS